MRYHYVWLLWSLAFGMYWSGVYEHVTWQRTGFSQ